MTPTIVERRFVPLMLFLLFLLGSSAASLCAEPLPLDLFLERVLQGNEELETSRRDLEARRETATLSVVHQRSSLALKGAGWLLSEGDREGYGYVQLALTQPFDLSGRYSLEERHALLTYAVAVAGHKETVNDLLGSAEEVYWSALMARRRVRLQETLLDERRETLRVVEERFRQGLVPRLDVVRASTRLKEQENLLVRARADARDELFRLSTFVGGGDVEPDEGEFRIPSPLEADRELALRQRPALIRLEGEAELCRIERALAARGMAPALDGSVAYTALADPEGATLPDRGEVVFRLDLTLPLSDGGRTRAERARAEASLARARSAQKAEERALEEELELARNRWERAAALEGSAREQVVQADEEFRVTLLMYEEGYGSQLDVMEAQTEQQRARTEELDAVREMCLALVDMRRAMGVYGAEEVFP